MEAEQEGIEKCLNYEMAHSQRENELARGKGTRGTAGFEQVGCYECDGYNADCRKYLILEAKQE